MKKDMRLWTKFSSSRQEMHTWTSYKMSAGCKTSVTIALLLSLLFLLFVNNAIWIWTLLSFCFLCGMIFLNHRLFLCNLWFCFVSRTHPIHMYRSYFLFFSHELQGIVSLVFSHNLGGTVFSVLILKRVRYPNTCTCLIKGKMVRSSSIS